MPNQPTNRGTNITPLLEQILGVTKINSKKDLEMLIQALEQMGDEPIFNSDKLAEVMESIQKKTTK